MRHWEISALMATLTVGGLTSLFAQSPVAPTLIEPQPTPAIQVPASPMPVDATSAPGNIASPLPMNAAPIQQYPAPEAVYPAPVEVGLPPAAVVDAGPANCSQCAVSAPAANNVPAAPAPSCNGCQAAMAAPPMIYAVPQATASCGCQSGSSVGFNGVGAYGSYGDSSGVSGVFGVMGSGSGVGSGLLSPVANSGGLHARYPYYNYRHSWYYQGPASQNVTIVW